MSAKTQRPGAAAKTTGASPDLLGGLVEETYRLYFALRRADTLLHGEHETTEVERGPLFNLLTDGPRSVPDLARERSVTRQRMQQIVNRLRELELVERRPNPASDKSPLFALTTGGRRKVKAMLARERKMYRNLMGGMTARKLRSAQNVLQTLREEVESRL